MSARDTDPYPASIVPHDRLFAGFELVRIAGQSTSDVMKDVVMVGGCQEVEVDFVADNPGPALFHCHQQLHMDFGVMTLFDYV